MRALISCPYCRASLQDGSPTLRCKLCGTIHHTVCWEMNARCSVYGCPGSPVSGNIHFSLLPSIILILAVLVSSMGNILCVFYLPAFMYSGYAVLTLSRNGLEWKNQVLHFVVNLIAVGLGLYRLLG